MVKKVKFSHYRAGVAQRVGTGIAILFHDRSTRRGWLVSSMPQPHFTPGNDPVPILQEAGWAPGPVWTGGNSRLRQDSIPDLTAHSQSLYRISYPAHMLFTVKYCNILTFSSKCGHCLQRWEQSMLWTQKWKRVKQLTRTSWQYNKSWQMLKAGELKV